MKGRKKDGWMEGREERRKREERGRQANDPNVYKMVQSLYQ